MQRAQAPGTRNGRLAQLYPAILRMGVQSQGFSSLQSVVPHLTTPFVFCQLPAASYQLIFGRPSGLLAILAPLDCLDCGYLV
jgi:hypothetical protein